MKQIKNTAFLGLCFLAFAMLLFVSSCATIQKEYHEYIMRGSIVDVVDSEPYLCIGSRDGATVGQELNVYRIVQISSNSKTPIHERQLKGRVKITEIVDKHFAKAKVISGTADKNDIVELSPPPK